MSKSAVKKLIREVCPPVIWNGVREMKKTTLLNRSVLPNPNKQDLNPYFDEEFAKLLDTWGEKTAWNELRMLFYNCQGKVLDIACGTGVCMKLVEKPGLEIYGCDISELLIKKAIARGIPAERLKVCDATKTDYPDNFFDYAYSVGSLEHFTEEGILGFIRESARICRGPAFHHMPCSKSGKNEGWMKTTQSFFNNTPEWWVELFRAQYSKVEVLHSAAKDEYSDGKWFLCEK